MDSLLSNRLALTSRRQGWRHSTLPPGACAVRAAGCMTSYLSASGPRMSSRGVLAYISSSSPALKHSSPSLSSAMWQRWPSSHRLTRRARREPTSLTCSNPCTWPYSPLSFVSRSLHMASLGIPMHTSAIHGARCLPPAQLQIRRKLSFLFPYALRANPVLTAWPLPFRP